MLGDRDVVIFKVLKPPARRDFRNLVQQVRETARESGMRRKDSACRLDIGLTHNSRATEAHPKFIMRRDAADNKRKARTVTRGGLRAQLATCAQSRRLVQFVRRFESPGDHLIGVPLCVGRSWVALAKIDDRIAQDGFDAVRLSDIVAIRDNFKGHSFYVRGLRSRRTSLVALPDLNLDSTAGVLRSVSQFFSLLVLTCEGITTHSVDIGLPVSVSERSCTSALLGLTRNGGGAALRTEILTSRE